MTLAGVAPGIIMSFSFKFSESRTAETGDDTARSETGGKRARSFYARPIFDAGFVVLFSVAIAVFILGHGFSTETSRTDYEIWTNETGNTYAVVYQDDNRWCLERCEIADEKLTIDTSVQLWKSPLGIEVEKKHFDSVAKKAGAEDEADDQPMPEP